MPDVRRLLRTSPPSLGFSGSGETTDYADILILWGQSNALGLGTLSEAPSQYTDTDPKRLIWNPNDEEFQELVAGTNNIGATGSQFGPELSLMTDFLGYNPDIEELYLIKHAATNTSMAANWNPTTGDLWSDLLANINAALAAIVDLGKTPRIHMFGCLQGENDAIRSAGVANSDAYGGSFTDFIEAIRDEYNEYAVGNALKFIVAQMGNYARASSAEWYYLDNIRHAVIGVQEALPAVNIVRTDDLTVSDANVHYDTDSLIAIGQRMAQSAFGTLPSYVENRPPAYEDITFWMDPTIPFATDGDSSVDYILSRAKAPVWAPAQSTAGKKPTLEAGLNSLNRLSFDGGDVLTIGAANSMLEFFGASDGHIATILKRTANTQAYLLQWSRSGAGTLSCSIWDDGNIYFDWSNGTTGRAYGAKPAGFDNYDNLVELIRRQDDTQDIWINGEAVAQATGRTADLAAGSGTLTTLHGGSNGTPSNPFTGKIQEQICYKRALTTQERADLKTYFETKYAREFRNPVVGAGSVNRAMAVVGAAVATKAGAGTCSLALTATANGAVTAAGAAAISMAMAAACAAEVLSPGFKKFTYTGDGTTSKAVNIGMATDLVIATKQEGSGHFCAGAAAGKYVRMGTTEQESGTPGDTTFLTFDANGFTVGQDNNSNQNTKPYDGFAWRVKTGLYSKVTWTGNQTNRTISHGLGDVPKMIIVKCRTGASADWAMYSALVTASNPAAHAIVFSTGGVSRTSSSDYWNNTVPTSSVFSLGPDGSGQVNTTGCTYEAFVFGEVAGEAAQGIYTGNGSATGPTVTLGWQPSAILIFRKALNSFNLNMVYGNGSIMRFNDMNSGKITSFAFDITSTGFQILTSNADFNANGDEYVYFAWK